MTRQPLEGSTVCAVRLLHGALPLTVVSEGDVLMGSATVFGAHTRVLLTEFTSHVPGPR